MGYLTDQQRRVLEFIADRLGRDGVAPTLQEIADEFGFASTASAQKHIALLQKKGFLERVKHQKRGLLLSEAARQALVDRHRLPLLGTVAAGSPIESLADDETCEVPTEWLDARASFVLRVRGESMIDEGIHDGDLVIVRRADRIADGTMVVALVAGEVTLKRLFRHATGVIRLQPSNAAMTPLLVPADDLEIQGVVVGLMRRY